MNVNDKLRAAIEAHVDAEREGGRAAKRLTPHARWAIDGRNR